MTEIHRLTNADIEIELWSIGARLNGVTAFGQSGLVASSDSFESALGPTKNHGPVVGVVANRLARSEAPVLDRIYQLEAGPDGAPICHCGSHGVSARDWVLADQLAEHAKFTLSLADNEDGLPGNRQLSATYRLAPTGFDVILDAETDAPTLVNLALHPYWSIAGQGRAGQKIRVNAAKYTPVDADKIPLGTVDPVSGNFDLRRMAEPSHNIDHNFDLTARANDGPAVSLASDQLRLDIETEAPGLQVYTGNPLGIAIEPQHWPDAPHHANFPSILLQPGETYSQTSTYRFSRL